MECSRGSPGLVLDARKDKLLCLACADDGRWLAAGGRGRLVHLWNLAKPTTARANDVARRSSRTGHFSGVRRRSLPARFRRRRQVRTSVESRRARAGRATRSSSRHPTPVLIRSSGARSESGIFAARKMAGNGEPGQDDPVVVNRAGDFNADVGDRRIHAVTGISFRRPPIVGRGQRSDTGGKVPATESLLTPKRGRLCQTQSLSEINARSGRPSRKFGFLRRDLRPHPAVEGGLCRLRRIRYPVLSALRRKSADILGDALAYRRHAPSPRNRHRPRRGVPADRLFAAPARNDGIATGTVKDYEFYVGNELKNLGPPVSGEARWGRCVAVVGKPPPNLLLRRARENDGNRVATGSGSEPGEPDAVDYDGRASSAAGQAVPDPGTTTDLCGDCRGSNLGSSHRNGRHTTDLPRWDVRRPVQEGRISCSRSTAESQRIATQRPPPRRSTSF